MMTENPQRSQSTAMLNVAVVGHTNTGKTSLIRTMLRSTEFGAVEDAAGTTRHVEQAIISAGDEAVLTLYDTPGLEDSRALSAHIKKLSAKSKALSALQILQQFVAQATVNDPLEQEALPAKYLLLLPHRAIRKWHSVHHTDVPVFVGHVVVQYDHIPQ